MKKNLGRMDRALRIVVAIAIAILYFMDQISGTTAIALAVLALVFAATSFLSFCPIYYVFKLSTRRKTL